MLELEGLTLDVVLLPLCADVLLWRPVDLSRVEHLKGHQQHLRIVLLVPDHHLPEVKRARDYQGIVRVDPHLVYVRVVCYPEKVVHLRCVREETHALVPTMTTRSLSPQSQPVLQEQIEDWF